MLFRKTSVLYGGVIALFVLSPVHAINHNTDTTINAAWDADGDFSLDATTTQFFISGGLGAHAATRGTWDDEFGGVALVSSKIVEHGAYLCPYHIQCNNRACRNYSNSLYFRPSGFKPSQCVWMCSDGYIGTGCSVLASSTSLSCDTQVFTTDPSGKFGGLGNKTWGKDSDSVEGEVEGFKTNYIYGDEEQDVMVAAIEFLEHGVVAAAVALTCHSEDGCSNRSWISSVTVNPSSRRVLCAPGYKTNVEGTDCVPVNYGMCELKEYVMCDGFPRAGFDPDIHYISEDPAKNCVKYFCEDEAAAFPAAGNVACEPCASGIRGGPRPDNGVCTICQLGQYFERSTGLCKTAASYSRTDLQYGRGQTNNTVPVKQQCWTMDNPTEYVNCVKGQKTGVVKTKVDNVVVKKVTTLPSTPKTKL